MNEKKEEENLKKEEETLVNLLYENTLGQEEKTRNIFLYNEIDENSSGPLISHLLFLKETGMHQKPDPDNEGSLIEVFEPIKLYISTPGGGAHDMFSIYDTMRLIEEECEIHTFGLGRVMSAGVLVLAGGTKGKRKIGRNCRVMIHPVASAAMGDLQDIENDTKEIKWLQSQYIKSLAKETNLTEKKIKSILRKKINHYFSAEQAIDMGIADVIF